MRKRKPILLLFCLFLFILGQAQVSKTVNVTTPGTLSTLLTPTELNTITDLTLTGNIDARDIKTMRDKMTELIEIDMSNVSVMAYSGVGGTDVNKSSSDYFANTLPAFAFTNTHTGKPLQSIVLPNTITKIGEHAFFKCYNLRFVTISNSITTIGDGAFNTCSNLTTVINSKNLISIGSAAFGGCFKLTSFALPESLATLGDYAFYACKSLKSISIPGSITVIGEFAFADCDSLKTVSIAEGVTLIGNRAFHGCHSLHSIVIPNSVISIGEYAFCYSGLEFISIPKNVKTIGCDAFSNCYGLNCIYLYVSKQWDMNSLLNFVPIVDKLYVPLGCKPKDAAQWGAYDKIHDGVPVDITTQNVRDINLSTPTGNGNIVNIDANDRTEYGLVWSTNINPTVELSTKSIVGLATDAMSFSSQMNGLRANTLYYVRAYATNSTGTSYGEQVSFISKATGNLDINNPIVITNKMVDGNTSANIIRLGTLVGVDTNDVDNVAVSASATYATSAVGTDKTITVIYSLSGSAASKYFSPENYVVTNAKISDYVTLNDLTIPVSGCETKNLDLPYRLKTGTPTQYKVTFDNDVLTAGMNNIEYTNLPSDNTTEVLSIPIPAYTTDGKFKGKLKMKNELDVESPDYPFTFTINVSSKNIISKFDDIVLFNNYESRFAEYQWYKNGVEISGATKQFYCDPEGLNGDYSARLITTIGDTLYSCAKMLNIRSNSKSINFPNPVKQYENFTISLTEWKINELKSAIISVYSMQGECVYKTNNVNTENTIHLDRTGIYLIRVEVPNQNYVSKIIVTQ